MENIIFTSDIRTVLDDCLQGFKPEDIFILTDQNTARHCLPLLNLTRIKDAHRISIQEGETHKSLESAAYIWNILSNQGARRNSVLVNIGGGLVTDIGGFAASCFKRGIKCINIPTTLLSQVDASVGGKTGINFNGLKNEIGTFTLPSKVIIDTCFLKTLPYTQLLSGFGEMLKHALLAGGKHFEKILQLDLTHIDWANFSSLIQESVEIKYAVVQHDPKETGIRKALNFGHTAGHALESAAISSGRELSHGAAIAYGMIAELCLSVRKMGFNPVLYEKIVRFIRNIYPEYMASEDDSTLYELMLHDKKNDREGVNFTLLQEPGAFSIDNYCSREEIEQALQALKQK